MIPKKADSLTNRGMELSKKTLLKPCYSRMTMSMSMHMLRNDIRDFTFWGKWTLLKIIQLNH